MLCAFYHNEKRKKKKAIHTHLSQEREKRTKQTQNNKIVAGRQVEVQEYTQP